MFVRRGRKKKRKKQPTDDNEKPDLSNSQSVLNITSNASGAIVRNDDRPNSPSFVTSVTME